MLDIRRRGVSLIFFALIVFFGAAAPALASNELHLLRPGNIAVADLNGDLIPDMASGVKTGRSARDYTYRVDLELNGHSGFQSFIVYSAEPTGLNVEARDVDGDRDLDLVITSHLAREPIGILLNDGHGRFTRGDPAQFSPTVWRDPDSVRSSTRSSVPLFDCERRRVEEAGDVRRVGYAESFDSSSARFQGVPLPLSLSGNSSARLRAPPRRPAF